MMAMMGQVLLMRGQIAGDDERRWRERRQETQGACVSLIVPGAGTRFPDICMHACT